MKATEFLKKQHREVKRLFSETKKAEGSGQRRFHPAVAEVGTKKAEEIVPEAYEEHHVAKLAIAELPEASPEDERWLAKMTVLEELIEHHVEEEESEIFKLADKLGAERLSELGEELEAAFAGRAREPRRAAAAGR